MTRIVLTKGASFTGYGIKATRKEPSVLTDEATAKKAVASGYFKYDAYQPLDTDITPETVTDEMPFTDPEPEDIAVENMTLAQLKSLASQMGIDTKGLRTKAAYIETIEKSAEAHGA